MQLSPLKDKLTEIKVNKGLATALRPLKENMNVFVERSFCLMRNAIYQIMFIGQNFKDLK